MLKSFHRNKALSFVLYLILAFIMAYVLIHHRTITLKVDDLAPLDEKISLLSGPQTFRRLLKKPLVINFWATWCPPCQKELPVLAKLAEKYQEQVIFIGATIDSPMADILAIKNKVPIAYLLGLIDNSVATKWQANALPTTYIIDIKGRIAWAHTGIVHEAELEAALANVLKK